MQGMFECPNCHELVWYDIFGETEHECESAIGGMADTSDLNPDAKA